MSLFCIIIISICILFHGIVYRGKHLTNIVKNVLLNTNFSQNTSLFTTYYPEPFHNKYNVYLYMAIIVLVL